jgi:hypothetical protein
MQVLRMEIVYQPMSGDGLGGVYMFLTPGPSELNREAKLLHTDSV